MDIGEKSSLLELYCQSIFSKTWENSPYDTFRAGGRYVRVKVTAELKMAFRLHETDDEGDQQVSDQATRSKRKKVLQKYRIEWEYVTAGVGKGHQRRAISCQVYSVPR